MCFLIIYIIGMIVCGWLIWRINQKHTKEKYEIFEIIFLIYCILISWVGVFSLIAGQISGFNETHRDDY